jgi:hypothetical protein
MSSKAIHFRNGRVSGNVSLLGGMLGPVEFLLPNNRAVQPFSVAPWNQDPENSLGAIPPILQNLSGEWPCVPFGVPELRRDLPVEWLQDLDSGESISDKFIHGFSSNHDWTDRSTSSHEVALAIDYPPDHPVRKLSRTISVSNNNQLNLDLVIETDRQVELPIGIHTVFKLPNKPGRAKLIVDSFKRAHTFPVSVEANRSILKPNQQMAELQRVLRLDGRSEDLTCLPLAEDTEELVLLELSEGMVKLQNLDELYEVVFTWDIKQFPSCLLWISNYGRETYPWNKRFQAIGIEPIAAAFDLGVVHSRNISSPLKKMGIKTSFSLTGCDRFTYQIAVNSIEAN